MSMLQTRNVTSFLLGKVDVVHRRSKIDAASNGLIIIIIDECKNPKYIKHVLLKTAGKCLKFEIKHVLNCICRLNYILRLNGQYK